MSDCGVCVYSGVQMSSSDYFHQKVRVARKEHQCCECGKKIVKGEQHKTIGGRYEGEYWHDRICLICDEIGSAFSCDGRMYGYFWEAMDEVWDKLTTSCFDKLKTPEAKAELQRRWMQWKGLAA